MMAPEPRTSYLGFDNPADVTVVRKITDDVVTFAMPHVWPAKFGNIHVGARCTACAYSLLLLSLPLFSGRLVRTLRDSVWAMRNVLELIDTREWRSRETQNVRYWLDLILIALHI